jgi:hypothetical protein
MYPIFLDLGTYAPNVHPKWPFCVTFLLLAEYLWRFIMLFQENPYFVKHGMPTAFLSELVIPCDFSLCTPILAWHTKMWRFRLIVLLFKDKMYYMDPTTSNPRFSSTMANPCDFLYTSPFYSMLVPPARVRRFPTLHRTIWEDDISCDLMGPVMSTPSFLWTGDSMWFMSMQHLNIPILWPNEKWGRLTLSHVVSHENLFSWALQCLPLAFLSKLVIQCNFSHYNTLIRTHGREGNFLTLHRAVSRQKLSCGSHTFTL